MAQVEDWRKVLKQYCGKAFKKIRVKKKTLKPINSDISKLIKEKNELSKLRDVPNVEEAIETIDRNISEIEALENRKIILENFKSYSDNPETINMQEMWKKNKKLWPKCDNNLPTAK